MKINRHQIREYVFQTLFAMQSNDELNLDYFFKYLTDNDEAVAPDYYKELVNGVEDNKEKIDKIESLNTFSFKASLEILLYLTLNL